MAILGEKLFYLVGYTAQGSQFVNFYVDTGGLFTLALDPREEGGGEKAGEHRKEGAAIKPDTQGDTDYRRRPHYGGGGKTGYHFIAFNDYHTCAQKAYARNDLRGNTQGVVTKAQNPTAIDPNQSRHHTAEADENVSSHTRLTSVATTLEADKTAEDHGKDDSEGDGRIIDLLKIINCVIYKFHNQITPFIYYSRKSWFWQYFYFRESDITENTKNT